MSKLLFVFPVISCFSWGHPKPSHPWAQPLPVCHCLSCQDRGPLFPGSSCFPLSPDHKHKLPGCTGFRFFGLILSVWSLTHLISPNVWWTSFGRSLAFSPLMRTDYKYHTYLTQSKKFSASKNRFSDQCTKHLTPQYTAMVAFRGAENMISWIWFSISWAPGLQSCVAWMSHDVTCVQWIFVLVISCYVGFRRHS